MPGGPGLARSRSDADRVLRVLRREGAARRVATVAEVHVQALMQELSDLSVSHELDDLGPVGALRAYDADHAGELERTLRVWLDELGDVGRRRGRAAGAPEHLAVPAAADRRGVRARSR